MVCGGLWLLSRYKTDFANKKDYAMLKNNKWKGAIYTTSRSAPELDRIYITEVRFWWV